MESKKLSTNELKKIQEYEIEILKEIDRICQKYNIKYSIAFGTMLGQVRHNGFIPWDDDVDIFMLRDDYDKFKEICKKELNDKFFYQSHETDKEYYYLYDKIRYNNTIFKETFVSQYNIHHGIFLDIFPIDKVSNHMLPRIFQHCKFQIYRVILDSKYMNINARHGLKKVISKIIRFLFKFCSLEKLYNKAIKICIKKNNKQSCNKYVRNFNESFSSYKWFYEVSKFQEINRVSFENIKVNCLNDTDYFLKKLYRNYMELPPVDKRKTVHDLDDLKL